MNQRKKADWASRLSFQDDLAYNAWLEEESRREPESENDYLTFRGTPRTVKQLRGILDAWFAGALGCLLTAYFVFRYLGAQPGAAGTAGKVLGVVLLVGCVVCYHYEKRASQILKDRFQEDSTRKRAEAIVDEEAGEAEEGENGEDSGAEPDSSADPDASSSAHPLSDAERLQRIRETQQELQQNQNKKGRRFLRWLF